MDLTARTTGLEFTQELGRLITFRGGKIVRSQDFLSHADALEAGGRAVSRPRFVPRRGILSGRCRLVSPSSFERSERVSSKGIEPGTRAT
jgi:hypothetical protein